jgi:Mg/Co/Ni transporter MgtE
MHGHTYDRGMHILHLPHRTAVASDVVALVVFVTIGLLNHRGGVSATGYARDALPILACWLLAAGTFDLYRRPRSRALLGTWLAGVTGGVAIRALTLWRFEGDDVVFLCVALGFTLLFVVVFRALAGLAPRLA